MRPFRLIFLLGTLFGGIGQAVEPPEPTASIGEATEPEPEQPFSADEGDAQTSAVTPISSYQQRKPYDQARLTLQKAQDIWKKGDGKLASETALEAYDDLIAVRVPRKQKQARRKLLSERRKAAEVYVDASIAYIKEYVNKRGTTVEARMEGRGRLAVLRDVSRDYPDLNNKVTKALDAWSPS